MKVRKYGGFDVAKGSELYFAIAIQFITDEDRLIYKFVTDIDVRTKSWKVENNKVAYLFDDRSVAQEICACMILNGTSAFVAECLSKNRLKNCF